MTEGPRPLGPAWDRPLTREELSHRIASGVAVDRPLPQARELVGGCSLYGFTDMASDVSSRGSVCVLGAFDGVHVGHRELVSRAVSEARDQGVASVAVTFSPDPAAVLAGPIVNATLLCVEDRVRLLSTLGLDAVLVVPFTRELASTSYERFLTDWLVPAARPLSIHVGADFRMGAGGAGTVDALREVAGPLGIDVHGHELVSESGQTVSATRIRGLVRAGKVEAAAGLLERDHMVRGQVEHGRGEGASFGFPTANVRIPAETCLPAEGVYAALACDGAHAWPAAVNVGAPRSFGGAQGEPFLEATLLGFSGDLYGARLSVNFVAWLREPRRFSSLGELEATVLGNVAWVGTYLGEGEVL